MDSLQFSLTPYSINALALFFIGLAGTLYMLRLQVQTTATRLVTLALAGFCVGMLSWVATGIVLWGSALNPFTDTCAVISMAAMIEFGYHYPQKIQSLEASLMCLLGRSLALGALAFSLAYAGLFLVGRMFTLQVAPAFWAINPIMSLLALGICIRRMLALQHETRPGLVALSAFWNPVSRPARLLRNFVIALSFGMLQGVVSFSSLLSWNFGAIAPLLIDLSFSLMMIAVVYTVFELTDEQPRLLVRLIGLSAVTILGLIGIVGTYAFNMANQQVGERTRSDLALAQSALAAGDLSTLPQSIRYIIVLPRPTSPAAQNVLSTRLPDFNAQALLNEPLVPAAWEYVLNLNLPPFTPVRLRFGDHSVGSVHQFAEFPLEGAETTYGIGFSLDEMNRAMIIQCRWVLWLMLGAGVIVLVVFPRYYHTSLIRPLDRLLDGVRQVEGGNLEIVVPVTYQDEVGYLTTSFNKMTASLQKELAQRQRAEAELRQLNLTLEQRVADRTRELEALYDVSAAASQAQAPQELLNLLLERTLAALRCPMGMILLLDGSDLHLAADCGLPASWQDYLNTASTSDSLLASILSHPGPLLITDTHHEGRLPGVMRQPASLTMLLAALPAEGEVTGMMGIARPVAPGFDLDEIALFVSLMRQVGTAVHTDRLRQAAQRADVLEERQRLARDLHDSVTQSLYGLAALTEAGKMRLETGDLATSAHLLTRIGQTARQAIREMRLFLHQLRPPVLEQEGLVSALELRLAAVEGRSDVRASLEADESIHLSADVETALYHIAQEALNNALKHAAASYVTVRLYRTKNAMVMEIADDGCGFDPKQAHGGGMGLDNMRARAEAIGAALEIDSFPGQGTKVTVRRN